MEYYFNKKSLKAIGVSNFEVSHLQDILDLNSEIPSVNQFEFHGYWHEYELVLQSFFFLFCFFPTFCCNTANIEEKKREIAKKNKNEIKQLNTK